MAPLATNTPTATPTCGPPAWTTQASYPITIDSSAVVAHNGLIYSFGGFTGSGATANAYVYDPPNNTWTAIASLPAVREGAAAVSDGTYIYIVAGTGPSGNLSNTLYRY